MMNAQEFFDTTVTVLRAQGGPSINEKGVCLYRGPNGRKCAAGIHITDEEYDPTMDPLMLHKLLIQKDKDGQLWLPSGHALRLHSGLAGALQSAHDRAARAIELERTDGGGLRESMTHIREGAEFFIALEPNLQRIAGERGLIYTGPK